MGDQRRRGGRSRSGRGGRIPRRGEGGGSVMVDEAYVSFPLTITGPIRVESLLDEAAVTAAFAEALRREAWLRAALEHRAADPYAGALASVVEEAAGHAAALQELAGDLSIAVPPVAPESVPAEVTFTELVAAQRATLVGIDVLLRLGNASGERRIERALAQVRAEKARHGQVLEQLAVEAGLRGLFTPPEY